MSVTITSGCPVPIALLSSLASEQTATNSTHGVLLRTSVSNSPNRVRVLSHRHTNRRPAATTVHPASPNDGALSAHSHLIARNLHSLPWDRCADSPHTPDERGTVANRVPGGGRERPRPATDCYPHDRSHHPNRVSDQATDPYEDEHHRHVCERIRAVIVPAVAVY